MSVQNIEVLRHWWAEYEDALLNGRLQNSESVADLQGISTKKNRTSNRGYGY